MPRGGIRVQPDHLFDIFSNVRRQREKGEERHGKEERMTKKWTKSNLANF